MPVQSTPPSGVTVEPGDLSLPRTADAIRVARHWAVTRARNRRLPDLSVRTVELLTSELATNAVKYGSAGLFVLRVFTAGPVFGVCVSDHNPSAPSIVDAPPEALGGRGLRLVSLLARTWGVSPLDGGKAVWFAV